MEKIAIIGGGELGQQFFRFIKTQYPAVNEVAYFDDNLFAEKQESSYPFNDHLKEEFNDYSFFVSLGYKHLDKKSNIVRDLLKLNRSVPTFIHSTSFHNPTSQIGSGNFIYPMCNIDKGVRIGDGIVLNNSVVISHDSVIGNGCYLSPGVVISGFVELGENCFIGAGAIVSNGVKIGKNVKIGIGTVVTKNIPDNSSVIGNPMIFLDKDLKLL